MIFFLRYWNLNSGPTPWTTPSPFLWWFFLKDSVSRTICLGWLRTVILLITASWVARITGVSHWHPARMCSSPAGFQAGSKAPFLALCSKAEKPSQRTTQLLVYLSICALLSLPSGACVSLLSCVAECPFAEPKSHVCTLKVREAGNGNIFWLAWRN
jgi:hypothetical protein